MMRTAALLPSTLLALALAVAVAVAVALLGCGREKPSADPLGDGGSLAGDPDLAAVDASGTDDAGAEIETGSPTAAQRVFIILMENHNWADIKGSARAPFIDSLLPFAASTAQYFTPPLLHPSEPNYLWLEAGTNFNVFDDNPPAINHQDSTAHLVTQLRDAHLSWKSYQEDIDGAKCPLSNVAKYDPKHNPMVFFDDSTGNGDEDDPYCIAHNRPYGELAADLANDTVPFYSFITPNLCDDTHDACEPQNDQIRQGDDWLARAVPPILTSKAFQDGATLFITWDEGEGNADGPIGMIVLSNNVKRGYVSPLPYTHSSTLRTIQEMLGVGPFLGDAANATDLSDLFVSFP